MSIFVISYDLRKPNARESDYKGLYADLDKLKAKRIQESVWALKSDELTVEEISDRLFAHLPSTDRLLVVEVDDYKNRRGINLIKNL